MASATEWRKLPVSLAELCINTTLRCGQSFRYVGVTHAGQGLQRPRLTQDRWRKSEDGEWSCALHGRILTIRQDSKYLHYRAVFPPVSAAPPSPPPSTPSSVSSQTTARDDTDALIHHYLNLGPNLTDLYAQWSAADANFRKRAPRFTGVRILKQDAWEALVGFICSSNNNIIRISQMVDKLCHNYGPLIGHIGNQAYHDFPTPHALAKPDVEQHLRQLGFGYRAKYIWRTAVMIAEEREQGWLDGLRNPESPLLGEKPKFAGDVPEGGREGYRLAHEALLELQGVGPKVADCVCLMGLGWGEAVPVDTHVWQIAQRDYKFGKGKHSSLTKATYDAIGNRFRSLWGKEAGWAHSVLFTADLRVFSDRLVAKVEDDGTVQVKEEIIEGVMTPVTTPVKKEVVVTKIKREFDGIELDTHEDMMSVVKRRRVRR